MSEKSNKFALDILVSLIPGTLLVLFMFLGMYISEVRVEYGILPRNMIGLRGILLTPFIHGDWLHFFSNMSGIWVLMGLLVFFYKDIWLSSLAWIWFLDGFWVWAGARESFHIGASGIVYGLAGFLFFSGILRKDKGLKAVAMLVVMFYGGLVWGIVPIDPTMSWEAHLFGLVAGAITAWYYRKDGPMNQEEYVWIDDIDDNAFKYWEIGALDEHAEEQIHDAIEVDEPETPKIEPLKWTYTYTFVPTKKED